MSAELMSLLSEPDLGTFYARCIEHDWTGTNHDWLRSPARRAGSTDPRYASPWDARRKAREEGAAHDLEHHAVALVEADESYRAVCVACGFYTEYRPERQTAVTDADTHNQQEHAHIPIVVDVYETEPASVDTVLAALGTLSLTEREADILARAVKDRIKIPLPTERGIYLDAAGVVWHLGDVWWTHDVRGDEEPEAPVERILPVAEVLRAIENLWGPGDHRVYTYDMKRIIAERFGIATGGKL